MRKLLVTMLASLMVLMPLSAEALTLPAAQSQLDMHASSPSYTAMTSSQASKEGFIDKSFYLLMEIEEIMRLSEQVLNDPGSRENFEQVQGVLIQRLIVAQANMVDTAVPQEYIYIYSGLENMMVSSQRYFESLAAYLDGGPEDYGQLAGLYYENAMLYQDALMYSIDIEAKKLF